MFIENETATQEGLCELLDKELKEIVKEKEELEKTFAEIPNELINIADTIQQIDAQEKEKAEIHVQMGQLGTKLTDNKKVLDKIEENSDEAPEIPENNN